MNKLKKYVFSAIVILIVSFSDEAESKSKFLEIDRRIERAVEAWSNGTSLAQADTDTSDSDGGIQISRREADDANAVRGVVTGMGTGSNRQATAGSITDPETGIRYGCSMKNNCWRSCKYGEFTPGGWSRPSKFPTWDPVNQKFVSTVWEEFCKNDEWCYSDLGVCEVDSSCSEAVKWGCYGWGTEPGRMTRMPGKFAPCPKFGAKYYYCDTKTERSFGCDNWIGYCWRSCNEGEKYCDKKGWDENKNPWCIVNSGKCTYAHRC